MFCLFVFHFINAILHLFTEILHQSLQFCIKYPNKNLPNNRNNLHEQYSLNTSFPNVKSLNNKRRIQANWLSFDHSLI